MFCPFLYPELKDQQQMYSFWGIFPAGNQNKFDFSRSLWQILTFSFRGPSGIPDFGGYSDTDSQVKGKVSIDSWSCCCWLSLLIAPIYSSLILPIYSADNNLLHSPHHHQASSESGIDSPGSSLPSSGVSPGLPSPGSALPIIVEDDDGSTRAPPPPPPPPPAPGKLPDLFQKLIKTS